MMVPGKDSLESFLNPIQVLKLVFSPLELNFRKVAMKFEHCFNGVYVNGDLNVDANNTNKELVADQLYLERKGGASTDHFMAVNECGIQRKVPMKIFVGTFWEKSVNHVHNNADNRVEDHSTNVPEKRLKQRFGRVNGGKEDGNCLYLEVAWSFLVYGFIHGFPAPFSPGKTRIWTSSGDRFSCKSGVRVGMEPRVSSEIKQREFKVKEIRDLSFEYFFSVAFDQLSHFPNFNVGVSEHVCKNIVQKTSPSTPFDQVDYFKTLISILEGKRADVNGFLGNLRFARVGRVPTGLIQMPSLNDVVDEGDSHTVNREDEGGTSLQNLVIGFLSIPLSNVERLKSTLSNVSFMELIEFLPQMGRPIKEDHPDKKKLFSVQDFFRYTEAEGKKFFLELDRDGDGQVTLEDLEVAMRKRKLPKRYALEFMRCARKQLFSKSFGWKQFLSLMEQKEPTILRAYTSLCLSKSGMLKKSQILASLKNAGLPANEDNAVSMMRFLNDNTEESVSYGHFRNFMLLLPSDRLQGDPRSIWFEAATVVAVPPPVEIPAGSVLKSALAGGLSCALSTSLLYPVDTIKAWAFMLNQRRLPQNHIERELEPWETTAVGALSGGLAAVLTTPFDVIKTRTMTSPPG